MKFAGMVLVSCKKYFKNYLNIILMFILPIVVVAFVNFLISSSSKGLDVKVGIINMDKGKLGEEFIKDIGANNVYDNKKDALNELKDYSVIAVYEIPENFTQEINDNIKPQINAYKIEKGSSTQIFEGQMEQKLNQLLKVHILKNADIIKSQKEIDKNLINVQYSKKKGLMDEYEFMPIVLTMFFLLSFSASLSTDLLNLRNQKILERFLSTSNNGYEIMGSIYLSMWITQVTMYTASFLAMELIFKYNFQNFGILVLNVALMSMVSLSLGIMISRIIRDAAIVNLVTMLVSMMMFFLYISNLMSESRNIPKIFMTISKFTPFYWSLESIEKSQLFPNAFILILIALVFFTAGNIRYSSFAKKQ